VQDRRFFSCVANMVLLPTPMKAFTDEMPDVKSMLRICAKNFFGWQCDHKSIMTENAKLEKWQTSDDYPESWPRQIGDSAPLGVMPINADIRQSAVRRWRNIQEDLERAGPHYPQEEVRKALAYWKLDPENPLMNT